MSSSLEDFAKSPKKPLSERQLNGLRQWLDDDWEAKDHPEEVRVVIKRLLLTIENIKIESRG